MVRHVAGCPGCRHEVAELARVADDLLLLDPGAGTTARLRDGVAQRIANLTNLRPRRPPEYGQAASPVRCRDWSPPVSHRLPPRVVRLAAVAVVLVVAAAGGAGAAYWQSASDRQLADRYRQTVAASGYPTATPVTSTTGTVVGHLFLYQGSPSWAMVAITDAPESGNYSMVVLTTSGHSYSVGVCDSHRSQRDRRLCTDGAGGADRRDRAEPARDPVDRPPGLTPTAADWSTHRESQRCPKFVLLRDDQRRCTTMRGKTLATIGAIAGALALAGCGAGNAASVPGAGNQPTTVSARDIAGVGTILVRPRPATPSTSPTRRAAEASTASMRASGSGCHSP